MANRLFIILIGIAFVGPVNGQNNEKLFFKEFLSGDSISFVVHSRENLAMDNNLDQFGEYYVVFNKNDTIFFWLLILKKCV